ncbi:lipopolysaccharide biosynthesis protein [Streptomyces sp. NP160]|nr:lipopolysaccharide biosynthesis protein [Streptomyces sp. NP160]
MAARGAAVTTIGQVVRIGVQLLGIVVLARLLDPSAYGVVTMVVAITGIGEVLRDFGLSSAAIQAKEVSLAQRTNLFWINTAIGLVLTLAVIAASHPIASLYDDERLVPIAAAISVTFLLNGVATQHRADLTRRMRFTALAVVDTSAQVAGLLVAVGAAAAGAGYWALVAQQLTSALVQLVALVWSTRWIPGLPRRGVPMRQFLKFGSNLAAVQLLGYSSRNVDSVVIGATVGASALGLYNRAFQLMMLPLLQINAPSTRVALPVLSRLQDEPERFARYLRVGQGALLSATALVLAVCAAQAEAVVDVALGSQWEGVVTPFRILSVAGFASTAGYATYWVILAKGLTAANLRFALVSRPLMIGAIALGGTWGVLGVATAYAVSSLVLWPSQLLWLARRSDAPAGMMFTTGARVLAVNAAAGAVSYASTEALDALWTSPPVLDLLVGTFVLLLALAVTALVVPPYRRDLRELFALVGHLRNRRAPAPRRQAEDLVPGGAS